MRTGKKEKAMKKVIALLLAVLLLLGLVACGEDTDTDTQPSDHESTNDYGIDITPSAGIEVTDLLSRIPKCDEINFDEFKLLKKDDYVALIFSGREIEDLFYAYRDALHDAGYWLSHSSDSEYDEGLIEDYRSGMNADPDIRLVLSGYLAIIIGENPPEASECFGLLDVVDQKSELRKSFGIYSNAVDIFAGEWVEQDGYGAMIFKDITDNTILDTLENDMSKYGFRQKDASNLENAQLRRYRQTGVKDSDRYVGYNADTKTVVIVVGELPSEYTCWMLLGMTKEELGGPQFGGDVNSYMPEDGVSCIRIYYSEKVSEGEALRVYQACDVSKTRLEKYIEELTALGYTQTVREEQDGSIYYEAKLKAYRDVDVYVTVQLAWSNKKLAYAFSAPGHAQEKSELLESAATYAGNMTGKSPDEAPDDGYQPLELSNATRVENVGSNKIYYFEGAYLIKSARLYIEELMKQGYQEGEMPYVPDVVPYTVEYAHNWLVNESMGDESWVIVAAWDKMAMVITSGEKPTYREHDLWDMVGCYMPFDIGYLETVYTEFCAKYGVLGFDGESWSSDGYFAHYGHHVSLDDVNWMIGELEKAGFVYRSQYTVDGADIWIYCRVDDYELLDASIYARILLKDGFGELEFGYGARMQSQNMQ